MSLVGMGGKRFKTHLVQVGDMIKGLDALPCLRGGDGPKEAGKPVDYETYHPTSSLPFWDWIELEDGTYLWLGRGKHGGYGHGN